MKSLKDIEKLINSELATKIQTSFIKNNELTIEINENDLIEVVQFLKSNENNSLRFLFKVYLKYLRCPTSQQNLRPSGLINIHLSLMSF